MSLFAQRPLRSPRWYHRLLKRNPRENALITLNNRLAEAEDLTAVEPEVVADLSEEFGVSLPAKFHKDLLALYESHLKACLADHHLSDREVHELEHLKALFQLSEADIDTVHDSVARELYGENVQEALADGRLSEEERSFLARLEETLKLPSSVKEGIYAAAAQKRLQRALDEATADERLSPQEEEEIQAIAQSLGAEIQMDERTRAVYDRLRLYWLIEHGDVPALDVEIRLQRNEVCYAEHHDVNWHELRSVTRSYRYGGVTGRVRIAKGIYLRAGELAVQRVSEDVLKLIDTGSLYLTNKRIIFMGRKKNSTITLKQVLDFKLFSNGVEIEKARGKTPFLEVRQDVDLLGLKLDRALRDANA